MNRNSAWRYYEQWMKEKTISPNLGQVYITRKGWDHIVKGSNKKKRNDKDRNNKFNLLKAAKYVIKNCNVCSIYKKGNLTYYELKYKVKIREKSKYNYRNVKVIFKKNKENKYEFFSLMKN